ncbi:MAG: ATP-binding protein [Bacteroidota bacterium]
MKFILPLVLLICQFDNGPKTEDELSLEYTMALTELDFQTAKKYSLELDLGRNLPYHLFIVEFLSQVGQKPLRAIQISEQLEALHSERNDLMLSTLTKGLYHLYNTPSNEASFIYLRQALGMAKESNTVLLPLVYLGILELYGQEIIQSSDDYGKYLDEFKKISNTITLQTWYQIHKIRYFSKSGKDRANITFLEKFDEFDLFFDRNWQKIPDTLKIFFFYYKGLAAKHNGNYAEAEVNYNKVIELGNGLLHFRYLVNTSYLQLMHVASMEEEFQKADYYRKMAKKLWNKSDTIRSRYIYNRQVAVWFYEPKGQLDSALFLLKSSIFDGGRMDFRKNTIKISESNIKLQTAEKEKQILIEQQRARTIRNWLIAATLAILLGAGIAILLQKNTTKKRLLAEQEALIKQQRVDNLLKEQELLSIDAMIAGQEKERQRVAGELHDDLGSLMATIKLHFDNINISEEDLAMQNAQNLLEKAYQKVRGIAHSKNSGVMSNQGLLPAIKKMAHTITETGALEVTVEDFGLGERMENSLELSVFRIIQELVANTMKHAEATQLSIQLTQHEDNLNIIVEDNGKGFYRAKVAPKESGMGLAHIEKRIEHLEGNFTIDSVMGKGTSILIDIPV